MEMDVNTQAERESRPISYTIPEAVRATGISRARIYQLVNAGELAFVKIGKRSYLTHDDLMAMLKRHRATGA